MSDMNNAQISKENTSKLVLYGRLVRLDKPIGTLLLLWPTLGALWIASRGFPDFHLLVIFSLGTFLMRSAGCAINDYLDRDIDKHVNRTESRVLTAGLITPKEALGVAIFLASLSFLLVLTLNYLTILLSITAGLIAIVYPLFKRFFPLPQAWLGIAFGFGIPMAYAAVWNCIPWTAWLLLAANVFWTIAYDTEYAMVDREDDLKLGLQSSAISFGQYDIVSICLCYFVALVLFIIVGWQTDFGKWALAGWIGAVACAVYHWYLIRERNPKSCFKAFLHNNWFGFSLFIGIVLDCALG